MIKIAKNTNTKENIEKINLMYERILGTFSAEVADQITHAKFQLEKSNNFYFIAKYNNIWVQIRIPLENSTSLFDNEFKLVNDVDEYLFIKNGVFIKKWFPGSDLYQIEISDYQIKKIFSAITRFHKKNIEVSKFDWNRFKIKDKKYQSLVAKYQNDELVFSHNNIRKSNVIINKFGFVKLVDFEAVCLNSSYYDLVCLHLNMGIRKDKIINYFKLEKEKFDDYIYLYKVYKDNEYKNLYAKNKEAIANNSNPKNKDTLKEDLYSSKFITFKRNTNFNYRLKIQELECFYFVPPYIYEDDNYIVWKWSNSSSPFEINSKAIKCLAKIMKTYHSASVLFPSFLLDKQIKKILLDININDLSKDIGSKAYIDLILKWISNIKLDANCHHNLNFQNIFWDEIDNLFIVDWAMASLGSKFLDIALMFENLQLSAYYKKMFWDAYNLEVPKDFYKYQLIALFISYLKNELTNKDKKVSKNLSKKIKLIINKNKIKISK
ncbi:Hypothetical protein MAU_6070 [Metamycoplasma auris 15026]|uniref:Uncharacterized protein n=1 Tax=Metamycoplasma auris 15026 TaxID=1188233 RepID=N9TQV1_9BACT|nr:hypothetical protein [Metamycoplasma auris]ENY68529.1 Hypothetical protein MAU_6070 [Metamycoplasma auris 15026]